MSEPVAPNEATSASLARLAEELAATAAALPRPAGEEVGPLRAWLDAQEVAARAVRHHVETRAARRREREERAVAQAARTCTFYGPVTQESVQRCVTDLAAWSRRDPGAPVRIVLNSPGGSVVDGLGLIDFLGYLQVAGHELTVVVLGMAASIGAVILQCADHRIVGPHSYLMLHEVSSVAAGKTSFLEDRLDRVQELQRRCVEILASKSALTAAEITERWDRRDWWLDARTAIRLGFADSVLRCPAA